MSITVNTSPSMKQVSMRPVLFEVDSDRTANTVKAVSGITSGTGAKARYAITSNTYKVGDIVTGSAFGVAGYNVRQTVMVINASWVETDLDYISSSSGSLTRTNDNFKIKTEVIVFTEAKKNI